MSWFAAHIIVSIRPTRPAKGEIDVFENVVLIEANDGTEATAKARRYGQASVVVDGTLKTMAGDPAAESFVGIRKIIEVRNPSPLNPDEDRPVDGTEISYSKLKVKDLRSLSKLADGEEVIVNYVE